MNFEKGEIGENFGTHHFPKEIVDPQMLAFKSKLDDLDKRTFAAETDEEKEKIEAERQNVLNEMLNYHADEKETGNDQHNPGHKIAA
jgi:hypothetical protein